MLNFMVIKSGAVLLGLFDKFPELQLNSGASPASSNPLEALHAHQARRSSNFDAVCGRSEGEFVRIFNSERRINVLIFNSSGRTPRRPRTDELWRSKGGLFENF